MTIYSKHPSTTAMKIMELFSSLQYFNEVTGLWQFPGLSTHVPRSADDPVHLSSRDKRRWLTNPCNQGNKISVLFQMWLSWLCVVINYPIDGLFSKWEWWIFMPTP